MRRRYLQPIDIPDLLALAVLGATDRLSGAWTQRLIYNLPMMPVSHSERATFMMAATL